MVFFAVAGGVVGVVVIGAASSESRHDDNDDYSDYSNYFDFEERQRREREARLEQKRKDMESYQRKVKVIVSDQMHEFLVGTQYSGKSYEQLPKNDPEKLDRAVKQSIADQGEQVAQGVAKPIKKEIQAISQAITDLENARKRLSGEVQQ